MASRTINTKRNIATGIVNKAITIIFPFVIRTAILYVLGEKYAGLSSLFTSILQVLNLAELGFSNAIVYNMYQPLANNDVGLVCSLLNYYKRVYRKIGSLIFIVGVLLIPFVPMLIKGDYPNDVNIYLLFFLYLINTSISYFIFAYKSALLNALQRMDLANNILTVTSCLRYLVQLVVIIFTKNFLIFTGVTVVFTLLNNLLVNYISQKKYPQYFAVGDLEESYKKDIKTQIGGLIICKLSDVSRNSFDSIVLSVVLGLSAVAIYDNYYYIYSSIYGIMLIITQAMQASVGNSIASETVDKNYNDLRKFQFIYSWISIVCVSCLACLYQPFMKEWVGKELMLSTFNMFLFCAYFYSINMNNVRNMYFNGNGLWWKAKLSFIFEALGNLFLNFILGYLFGITGILLATIITILIFNFFVRNSILFKEYFKISTEVFYRDHFVYFVSLICVVIVVYFTCENILVDGIVGLLLKLLSCLLLSNALLFLVFCKNEQFKKAKILVANVLRFKRFQ